jgi:phosphoesterase RecJ-like protein
LLNADYSKYLEFLGGEDEPISDEEYSDALAIVLDTGTEDRISNKKYSLCKEIIKIDHHIVDKHYGDYHWVIEEKSSTCEMIAEFYDTFKDELKIDSTAATYIYCGMVTDSGRFRFRDVSGDTLRLAGLMLDQGVNTDLLYANLYLKEFNEFKFESYAHEKMEITENGLVYLYVDNDMQEKFALTNEQASASVGFMDSIRGSIIWIAFIDNPDGSIRVRLRSRFVPVNPLAEKYRGGGHECACGATLYSKDEMAQFIADADALIKDYKENNEGWL